MLAAVLRVFPCEEDEKGIRQREKMIKQKLYLLLSRMCHEHYHNDIWSWAIIDQGRDAQRGDVSCEKRKGETNGNAHRCVAGSLQQQRRLDQCRPFLRAHRPDLRHVVSVC